MLVFDNTLLSDYLDGTDAARQFLQRYEQLVWAVPSLVLYEAYMGCIHGYIDGSPGEIKQAVSTSMDILAVTAQTADEAASLQEELLKRGVPADHPDALIAATAREHGATLATADQHFWKEDVQSVLDIAEYDPY